MKAKTPGQLVRASRERAGMTQVELARKLGIKPSSVSETESDRFGITVEKLSLIATAVGWPLRVAIGPDELVIYPAREG